MTETVDIQKIPIARAKLPQIYERAKAALAECAKVDECKKWADQASALGSYARQAQDKTLENFAIRIKVRAIRRAGELLRQLDARHGQNLPNAKTPQGGSFSRTEAARQAGMSKNRSAEATAIAAIPEDEFEAAIKSDHPPGVRKIIEALKKSASRPGFKEATSALGRLHEFSAFCHETDPVLTASGVEDHELEKARTWVTTVDAWLDQFVVHLSSDDPPGD
jgi:hypothetical protein